MRRGDDTPEGKGAVPALVISLARAPQRWANASRLLGEAGIPAERLDAVDAREADKALTMAYDAGRNRRHYFQPLKPTEIACFLSHRAAWGVIVASGDPHALVLEDDAVFGPELSAWTDRAWLSRTLPSNGVLKLYAKRAPGGPVVASGPPEVDGSRIRRPRTVPLGAVAQVVSREAARRLLAGTSRPDGSPQVHEPVDVVLQRPWEFGIEVWIADPAPVREGSPGLGGTTLGASVPEGWAGKLARELRRPLYRAGLALRSRWHGR